MKSGFENEIERVRAEIWRGLKVALSGVDFELLHSNMVGKHMFLSRSD
jgi:hypothetical protein